MASNYASDVESFVAHDDVNARESWAGTSFLMAIGGLALAFGAGLWWRRRSS
jgi:hypothetical protein